MIIKNKIYVEKYFKTIRDLGFNADKFKDKTNSIKLTFDSEGNDSSEDYPEKIELYASNNAKGQQLLTIIMDNNGKYREATRKSMIISKVLKEAEFTVKKILKLKENGTTRVSLENAKKIKDAGYRMTECSVSYNKPKIEYKTFCIFKREVFTGINSEELQPHEFTGFSVGYRGEGPNGLIELCKIFNINIDSEKVFKELSETSGRIWIYEEY